MAPTRSSEIALIDSQLGMALLADVRSVPAYRVSGEIWMTNDGTFLAEGGTVACNLKLRAFAA